jgi:hypothetical protein
VILADSDEPKLLLQEYDVPPVAVKLIAVLVHVNTVDPVLLVIPAVGAVLSIVVVTAAVEVQPLVPVTVTVYVPADETVIAAVVTDVDHA